MADRFRLIRNVIYDLLPLSIVAKAYFRIAMKYPLNLKDPKTINEKICWYKLNYCPNNKLIIDCTDKYLVREYLNKKGLMEHQVPLIGVYKDASEINYDELPEKFALKTNNGCHFNIVVTNKQKLNQEKTNKTLNKWLKIKFGKLNVEPHYNKINPLILCEEYVGMENKLADDYKIHCYNGKPCWFDVCVDRVENSEARLHSFDLEWNPLNYYGEGMSNDIPAPKNKNQMIEIASKIAKDFPFVRVDFYALEDRVLIGELTFVDAGGMNKVDKWADIELGKKFDLTKVKL